jgi:hypothetical protein
VVLEGSLHVEGPCSIEDDALCDVFIPQEDGVREKRLSALWSMRHRSCQTVSSISGSCVTCLNSQTEAGRELDYCKH